MEGWRVVSAEWAGRPFFKGLICGEVSLDLGVGGCVRLEGGLGI